MRVLHVIPSISMLRGGPSKAVLEMVAELRRQNIDAAIATTNDHGNGILEEATAEWKTYNGVPIVFFPKYDSRFRVIREFIYSGSFRRWLQRNIASYDLVHVHAIFSFVPSYTMWLCRQRKIPYIVSTHGLLEAWPLTQSALRKRCYLRLIERNNLENANRLHFTTESERQQATATVDPERTSVVPLGVPVPELARTQCHLATCERFNLSKKTPLILFLSRLHKKKGLELLIDALAGIKQPFQFLIAGTGEPDYETSVRNHLEQRGLAHSCKLLGFVDGIEKEQLMQAADLFVLTSQSENYGIAVVEAMAAATPILVTREVATAAFILEGDAGFVCDYKKTSVQRQIEHILQHPDTALQRGVNARKLVKEKLSWPVSINQLIDLYDSIDHQ